jgi:hypothetical protein
MPIPNIHISSSTCSVRIDVDQLLQDRENERSKPVSAMSTSRPRRPKSELDKDGKARVPHKRKSEGSEDGPKAKKAKTSPLQKGSASKMTVTLKLGPRPAEPEDFPCCLCVSTSTDGLLRVHDPPIGRKDATHTIGNPQQWMAHDYCANVVPETWVDEIDVTVDGINTTERVVFGVDAIVKDRWNLVGILVLCRNITDSLRLEMFCLYEESPSGTWGSCSMYEGKMPKSISRLLRTRWRGQWYCFRRSARSRKRGCAPRTQSNNLDCGSRLGPDADKLLWQWSGIKS